jgi:hypothetical protein
MMREKLHRWSQWYLKGCQGPLVIVGVPLVSDDPPKVSQLLACVLHSTRVAS